MVLRVLLIGDVTGDPGLEVLEKRLPGLVAENAAALTIVNGENAAGGFGLTAETLDRILAAGADVVTGGNHIWEKRDFWPVLEAASETGSPPVLRPANYPSLPEIPGRGALLLEKETPAGAVSFLVINLQGREKMTAIDCPFRCFDGMYERYAAGHPLVIVDFHAESSAEKEALGYYLDGRASLVAGTHTHVQTADERLLPQGTAYITDLGMTGAMNGVIGMDTTVCLNRARSQIAYRMECARPESEQDCAVQGIVAELDSESGRAVSIRRIQA